MPTKTTTLQAVNTMLSAIGEPPVNTLSSQRADSSMALQILEEVSREVQSQGWYFNTEKDVVLAPDSNGHIDVVDSVVRIDTDINRYSEVEIVLRGNRLFNKIGNTDVFSSDVVVTRVVMLDFEVLPEPARRYIMIRAGRVFCDRMIGSEKHNAFNSRDEAIALVRMQEEENDTADHSIFDDISTASVINRNAYYRTI
jgi:hypothetical protein